MQALVRRKPQWDWREEYVFRYFQMYLRANANPKPEPDGSFFLGNVEEVREKNWTKATPYSPAQVPLSERTALDNL